MTQSGTSDESTNRLLTIEKAIQHVHYLFNQGELAISAPITIADGKLTMDVSCIRPDVISEIDPHEEAHAIVFIGEDQWTWKPANLAMSLEHTRRLIVSDIPPEMALVPARKSPRQSLGDGLAKIELISNRGQFDMVDISDGGCSFHAPSEIAKLWPQKVEVGCSIHFANGVNANVVLEITRISFCLSGDAQGVATVSCKFTSSSFGLLLIDLAELVKAPGAN